MVHEELNCEIALENSKVNLFKKRLLNDYYVPKSMATLCGCTGCTLHKGTWPRGPLESASRMPGFLEVPYEPAVSSVTGITGALRNST